MVSLLERPAPCVFVPSILFHFIPFHSISFGSIPFFQIKNGMEPKRNGGREGGNYFYGAEWNGMERRQREGEGEKVRNYLYIIWKTETLRVTLM
jgi:hypothetical protein